MARRQSSSFSSDLPRCHRHLPGGSSEMSSRTEAHRSIVVYLDVQFLDGIALSTDVAWSRGEPSELGYDVYQRLARAVPI